MKIRLHMWKLKKNYSREEEDMECPISNGKEDTTEHVLEFQKAETVYRAKYNTPNQWVEVLMIYKQNKKKKRETRAKRKHKKEQKQKKEKEKREEEKTEEKTGSIIGSLLKRIIKKTEARTTEIAKKYEIENSNTMKNNRKGRD